MARKLTFQREGRAFEFAITKVDRTKLYGKKDVIATSPQGEPLQKGYLDEWGSVVIAATGMGYLDDTGRWHSKNELVAVDKTGQPQEILPSSFDQPIELHEVVDLATYMEHEAAMVYVLKGYDLPDLAGILAKLDGLYTFPFVYRATYESRPAFLNQVGENIFMIVGNPTELAFISKPQRSEIEDEDVFEDEDELDFSMM